MKIKILSLATFTFLCMCHTEGQHKEAGTPSGQVKFKIFSYIDKEGTGTEAFSMLMPSEWKFEGGVKWVLDNPSMPASAGFRVFNPNGKEEFEVFPNQPFFWTNNQMLLYTFPIGTKYFGNEVRPVVDAVTALKDIVLPRFRKDVSGLKISEEKQLPELAKALGAGTQSQPGVFASADGARIKIEYQKNGVNMEEDIYGVVEQISFPIQTMSGNVTNTIWFVDYLFSFKAEKGKLESNTKTFQAIAYSFKLNPQWFSKYNQVIEYLAQMQIKQIQSIGQLSKIISQTSNEISDMMMDSYNQRQAVNDHISENFSDYMLGVDKYYDPGSETNVKLPGGYNNAWANSSGEYILSDDPNYNPNTGSNLNWQKISKTK